MPTNSPPYSHSINYQLYSRCVMHTFFPVRIAMATVFFNHFISFFLFFFFVRSKSLVCTVHARFTFIAAVDCICRTKCYATAGSSTHLKVDKLILDTQYYSRNRIISIGKSMMHTHTHTQSNSLATVLKMMSYFHCDTFCIVHFLIILQT